MSARSADAAPREAAARGPVSGEDALSFLRHVLAAPFERGEVRAVTVAVPGGPPEALLGPGGADSAVFWDASSGPTAAGRGAAAVVTASGDRRFDDVRSQADALWRRLTSVAAPGVAPLPPRLFGGFSFLAAPQAEPWAPFGQARFVLPRILFAPEEGGGRLAVFATEDADPAALEREVAAVLSALGAGAPPGADAAGGIEAVGATGAGEWAAAIASIRDRIGAGRAEKIVAARMRELRVPGGADAAAVLRRLRAGTAAEARFALRFEGATFLGATPERLISLRGRELRTEALAGSIDADRADRAEELLASVKDAAEHAYVVHAIADALAPLCERLEYPPEPRIQRLRHVLHLQTPFAGRLAAPAHVLELVARLHPTPAVGGTPTAEAVAWIADEEPGARGWYAAPVGWFDAEGDGEFVVALRSALLTGDRARLYAGAGIVRDSDADAELAETEVKLRTMADALGWAP